MLTRRRLLGLGLAGGSALFMGGGLLALRGRAPAVPGLKALSDHEHRTLAALARVHLPRGGPFEVGAQDVDLAGAFDGFLVNEPPENVRDLKRALLLIEMGPLLFDRRLKTFSNLSEDERLTHWQGWMTSDTTLRRQASLAFRKFLSLVFFSQPVAQEALGYARPEIPEQAPAVGAAPAPAAPAGSEQEGP